MTPTLPDMTDAPPLRPAAARDIGDDGPAEPDTCPLCRSRRLHYAFSTATRRVVRCAECRLVLLNPLAAGPPESASEDDRGPWPDLPAPDRDRTALAAATATARMQLRQLSRYRGEPAGTMAVLDAGDGALAAKAAARGST